MALDWGLASPAPNDQAYLGPLQALAAGRQAALETRKAAARQAALGQAAQGDLEGAQRTALAGGDTDTADYVRAAQARASAGQVISMYGPPGAPTSAPAAPQSPAQSLIAAGTPGAAPAPNLARGGPVDSLAPLPDQAPPSPMADHMHDTAVAIGHAATSGQPVDPTQAWSHLYALDPAMGDKMMAAVGQMDTLRKTRLAETTDALGSAAQSILTSLPNATPQERAAAAQRMLPQLSQHGVTADVLTPANMTDDALKGVIGQALGLKGMLEQSNKETEFGFKGRELDQGDVKIAEEGRHDLAEERIAGIKPVQQGETLVDTGAAGEDGARTHGYTPSTANGGDNPPAVVAAKVATLAKAAGVDPDAPMTRQQFAAFVNALPTTEGGAGSLAARNNNPGNIRDGAFAKSQPGYKGANQGYAVFADPAAGMTAMRSLLTKNYYAKGQTSVRDIIEGKPVGGSSGPRVIASNNVNTLSDDAAESAAAIYVRTGQLPAGVARTKGDIDKILNVAAQMQRAVGSKPGDIATNWQDYKSQTKAVSAFASGPLGTQVRTMNVAVDHLSALAGSVEALKNGNTPLFNRLTNAVASATGKPAPTNFNALRDFVLDEVTKAIIGGGGTGGDRDKAQGLISAAQSPDQLYGAIGQVQRLMSGQLGGLRQQYETSTGRKDFERFLSPNTIRTLEQHGHGSGSAMPSGFRIVGRTPK